MEGSRNVTLHVQFSTSIARRILLDYLISLGPSGCGELAGICAINFRRTKWEGIKTGS